MFPTTTDNSSNRLPSFDDWLLALIETDERFQDVALCRDEDGWRFSAMESSSWDADEVYRWRRAGGESGVLETAREAWDANRDHEFEPRSASSAPDEEVIDAYIQWDWDELERVYRSGLAEMKLSSDWEAKR